MTQSHPHDPSRREFLKAGAAGSALALAGLDASAREKGLPRRALGKTGERVSVLGLGTAPAGQRPLKQAVAFYSTAIDLGVTYLDTAPDFTGYGLAQKALGEVLQTRRDQVFLVTKCFEPDGTKALALLERNLKELRTDHADLVYAHSVGDDKMDPKVVMGREGVLNALMKARERGLCRYVGISGHNRPGRFVTILEEFDIQVMMTAVNFVARHIYNFEEKVWPKAREKGVGLVAMKILGGQHKLESDPKDQPRAKGGRVRGEIVKPAFRYALGLPGVSTAVLGCYDEPELRQAIGWAQAFDPLSDQEAGELLTRGKELAREWGEVYGPA